MCKSFNDIIADIQNRTRTNCVIFVSMLIAGIILLAFGHMAGWLFVCMGAALGCSLFSKKARLNKELSVITDMDAFCSEFDSAKSIHFDLLGLTLMKEYAVMELPYLQIIPLRDMEKFEVGLQGDVRKSLFLTDRKGVRHMIAETQKGDALQEEFDRAYEAVRAYFTDRNIAEE